MNRLSSSLRLAGSAAAAALLACTSHARDNAAQSPKPGHASAAATKHRRPAAEKPKQPPKATAPWTPRDLMSFESVGDPRLSPEGERVVWEKSAWDPEEGRRITQLWLTSIDGKEPESIQLTRGKDSASHPRWSPDGRHIAFLSARPDPDAESGDKASGDGADDEPKPQVWLIDTLGGDPRPITTTSRGVDSFEWRDDETIIFQAAEDESAADLKAEEAKDGSVIVEDPVSEPPVRLYEVTLDDPAVVRLTANRDYIDSFTVSPDGRWAFYTAQTSLSFGWDERTPGRAALLDLESGGERPVFADRYYAPSAVRWDRDGKGFYALTGRFDKPDLFSASITELHHVDAATGKATLVPIDWERGVRQPWSGDSYAIVEDGVVAMLADGVKPRLVHLKRTGDTWKRADLQGDDLTSITSLASCPSGTRVLLTASEPDVPEQLFVADLKGSRLQDRRQLTELNEWTAARRFAKAETIRWKGANDAEVEGILYQPHDYNPAKRQRHPLVLVIHGGPFAADYHQFSENAYDAINLYAQRGAFVLQVNYHGSSDYGLPFAASIANGKYYELPVADIERGVDDLIARGLVDPEKLGVKGWSNGGILTLALIAHSNRYKVAACGAGGSEWTADWATCGFGHAFNKYYFGATPIEDPSLYQRIAPFYNFDKVTTPLIIFHGDADTAVPIHHAWMSFRALQITGKAPVRFVKFPGEEHGLASYGHVLRKATEEAAWFDAHLFGVPVPADAERALLADSPLQTLRQRAAAASDAGILGLRVREVLVPEVVTHEGIEVGRFEVTNAQYRAFTGEKVDPATANRPATNVTFEQANSYCAWLSKLTGATYRLPNAEEAETLYGEPSGNTLDAWAGYAPNPEDAARLQALIAALPDRLAVLRDVGMFGDGTAAGEALQPVVFDLGGNAAEWTTNEDGDPVASGGCAWHPADTKTGSPPPVAPPEFVGFRVVRVKE